MNKHTKLAISIDFIQIGNQAILKMHVPQPSITEWTLCLQLLLDRLVDRITITTGSHNISLSLCSESIFKIKNEKDLSIQIDTSSCNYLTTFFLKYYRDGQGEVDHVDIETPNGDYLTFLVDSYNEPVSESEARRRLE